MFQKQCMNGLWDREFCLPLGLSEARRKKLASSLALAILVSFLLLSKISLIIWMWDFPGAAASMLLRVHFLVTVFYLLFFTKCTPRQGLIIALVALPLLIKVAFFEAGKMYLHDFLLILVCRNIDTTKIARWHMLILSALFIVAVSLYTLGLAQEIEPGFRNGRVRPSLGFYNPNPAALVLTLACICLILAYWGRMRWQHYVLVGIGFFFNYFVTNSRSALLLLVTFLFFCAVFQRWPSILRNRFFQIAAAMLPLLLMAAALILGFLYDPENKLHLLLNDLFSWRISSLSKLFHSVSPDLFREVRIPDGLTMDNSYVFSLYYNGICVTAVYLLWQCILVYRLFKKGAIPESAIALSFILYGFFERNLFNPSLNPAYWLLGSVLFALPIEEQQLLCRSPHEVTSDIT